MITILETSNDGNNSSSTGEFKIAEGNKTVQLPIWRTENNKTIKLLSSDAQAGDRVFSDNEEDESDQLVEIIGWY